MDAELTITVRITVDKNNVPTREDLKSEAMMAIDAEEAEWELDGEPWYE